MIKNVGIEFLFSSDCNYEKLIIEAYKDGKFMFLLNQDDGLNNLRIEFPNSSMVDSSILTEINLATFEEALKLAKQQLRDK